jgi:hypothetical protein
MYSGIDIKETITCLIDSYATPQISLLHNSVVVPAANYAFEATTPEKHVTLDVLAVTFLTFNQFCTTLVRINIQL